MKKIPREDKYNQIVEAAARVFAEKGYSGATIADIALHARIGKGTVYEYFESKEALFFGVFEWFIQKTSNAAMVSISALAGTAGKRLEVLSEAIMSYWGEIEEVASLVMEFWAASSSSLMRGRFQMAFKQLYDEFRQTISHLVREGIEGGEFRKDVDPDAVAAGLVGTYDALFLQGWFDKNFDPLKTAKNFLQVVLRGLSKR